MIRQALYPDPSCRAVLAWLQTARESEGLPLLSHDTSAYCKARQRLPKELLPRLAKRVADSLTAQAGTEQLWHGRRVLAADGSAFSMPDTPENQERFPQPCRQKKGCGFPVGAFVAVACLATGAIVDAFIGGGKMHDLAMFYYVRSCFAAGDIFLADRGFSSYAEMALFLADGIDSVLRLNQRRRADFRRGRALGIGDHVVCWPRPKSRPKGLRPEDYEKLPPSLMVREIRYQVSVKGFRSRDVVLSTTLLDAEEYPAEELAELYFQRWEIEVDFRHLKSTMQMDVLRGHSPDVVEKEFWVHILAYNLLRRLMWESGVMNGAPPTALSVKGSIQHLLSRWAVFHRNGFLAMLGELLTAISFEEVPYRPGRVEPRVRKRRPKNYSLMTRPRHELKIMLPMYHY